MIPLPGMFATIRSRLGVVVAVSAHDAREGGRSHLVHIDYKDDSLPREEKLVWELEPHAVCQHPNRLPDASQGAMNPEDFDAVIRSARWTATMPYIDPDKDGPLDRLPVCSPLMGAVRVEDFQLVPLYKALAMPRVALLLADDVGLGKTIEAGLIISELVSRRRIGRILVLTPASLRDQWQDEMEEKFSLQFEVVDRESTQKLRKDVGIDANPWRVHDRIIASYHYLKQPDILELFMSASRVPEGSSRLPWDLIIVDECHNSMPSSFGEDSDLCRSIRDILPLCEHRLFLSATPHNGRTRSFTGLLEMLDPVRFTQSAELNPAARERVKQVMVRRLKRHIDESSKVRRFCRRLPPSAVDLDLGPLETALFQAFEEFRKAIHIAVAQGNRGRQLAGSFAVEILGKRLISCPVAFADSWWRSRDAFNDSDAASDRDVEKVGKASQEDTDSDAETEAREAVASRVVGAWLLNLSELISDEIAEIDRVLVPLGLGRDVVAPAISSDPREDKKIDETIALIDRLLLDGKSWKPDERLILFTEFKTTLDYLLRRLREHYGNSARFLSLFGGMDDNERRAVKDAFNDPEAEVRVLVATDAASEGLNLQQTARYMLHFDCPWNPMRLEQRIGRLDRHGQGRDVEVFHFTSRQSADLRFMARVIEKVDQVREDLGSCGEVFDTGLRRRLISGEDVDGVSNELFQQVDAARELCHVEADDSASPESDPLGPLSAALDLSASSMVETLDSALAWGGLGRPQLEPASRSGAAPGAWRLRREDVPGWKEAIDHSVRARTDSRALGAIRDLAFSADSFIVPTGGINVFKNRPDTVFVHLAHPMMRQGLQRLVRTRYPGHESISRWTVRRSPLPEGVDALILLSIEELGVNNLRETFHHWVRTVAFPVKNGKVGDPLADRPAAEWAAECQPAAGDDATLASDLILDHRREIESWIQQHRTELQEQLADQLEADQKIARDEASRSFQSRAGELSELIQNNTVQRLEREIEELGSQYQQRDLFQQREEELKRAIAQKKEEIDRRTRHLSEMRAVLDKERMRVIDRVIPNRYALGSDVAIFPVTLEVRLGLKGGAQ
jgi:superfamily II DNA or RNA helicase